MLSPTLTTFFDAMEDALRGSIRADDVESRCGPARPAERLELVLDMVRNGRRRVLRNVYAATRHACALTGVDFDAQVDVHLAGTGSVDEYPALALDFARSWEAPSWVHEVCDWEECLHRMNVIGAPAPRGRVRGPVIVRAYTTDVPGWARRVRKDEVVDTPPSGAARRVLLHRGEHARVRFFEPGAGELAALAEAWGNADEATLLASGVPHDVLARGRAELASRGLV